MLRIMLDSAPNDPGSLPNPKRPRFLSNQITLSSKDLFLYSIIRIICLDSLYSAEITAAAAARSHRQQIPQYPPASAPLHESIMITPTTPHDDQLQSKSIQF
jgi:hypothetical protein